MNKAALALIQRIMGGKGYEVQSMTLDQNGLVAVVQVGDESMVLTLARPAPALERGEPDRPMDPVVEQLHQAPPNMPPQMPAPMVMAKKPMFSAAPTFDLIKKHGGKLPDEAKALILELEKAELKIGDESLLLTAAKKAELGDTGALRELLAARRRPVAQAAAPPV